MSFLSQIRKLYKNLRDGLKWSRVICRAAARLKAELDASNADNTLKTAAQAMVTAADALCHSIEEYIAALPGNEAEEP